jgi:hypothetical protein
MESLKIPKGGETIHREPVKSNRFVDTDTILFFFGQLKEKGAAKKAAQKAESSVRRQFKNAGVSLNIYDTIVRLSEQEDADAVQKFVDEFLHIAGAFNHVAPGTQLNLLEGPGSVVGAKDKARRDGYARGLSGQNPDDQAFPQNTDLGQEHYAGWLDGQIKLQQRFVALNEKVRQEEEEKEAKKLEAAQRAEERAAKKAEKSGRAVTTNKDGDVLN